MADEFLLGQVLSQPPGHSVLLSAQFAVPGSHFGKYLLRGSLSCNVLVPLETHRLT